MNNNITVTINGKKIQTQEGKTILDVCKDNDIYVPTLCYKEDITVHGVCRLCVCEIVGLEHLKSACGTMIKPDMVIYTNSKKVRIVRKTNLSLLLSNCNYDCKFCSKNLNCEMQELISKIGLDDIHLPKVKSASLNNDKNSYIVRNPDKCVKCRRCVRACEEIQQVEAIKPIYRGKHYKISDMYYLNLGEVPCVNCGLCVMHCPTEALKEQSYVEEVWKAIDDPTKYVVLQVAPSIRASMANEFAIDGNLIDIEQLVTAFKQIGFDAVLDTSLTADLTVVEGCNGFIKKLKNLYQNDKKELFPVFTSCCPSWVKYAEFHKYNLTDYLSSCKSPQQMLGSLIKTYYAEKNNIDPKDIVSVSVMPCLSKKFESDRFDQVLNGHKTVDYSLTNREMSSIMRQCFVDFKQIEKTKFDSLIGDKSSSEVIFGNTGGVSESFTRNLYETITGLKFDSSSIKELSVINVENIKTFSITFSNPKEEYSFLDGITLNFAICQGLNNINKLLDLIINENQVFHFVEVMSCPGGCVGGGGQPFPYSHEVIISRIKALFKESENKEFSTSLNNPEIIALYNNFLEKPGSDKAKSILHTSYTERGLF